MQNIVSMYVLLSSEYIYGDNGIRFIFMEVNTGKLFKIEDKTNINPFFYTTVQVEDLLLDEMMIFEGYVKNGKFNSSRIMSTETVQKIDPFTRKEIPVTKINLASTYLLDIKRKKYNALQKVLPSHTIHNDNVKYVDQFTMMQGYIMGMNYDITMNGLEMIEPEEIFYHESFDSYSKELVDWAGLRLFASIPKISHNILAIDIEVDIPQRRNPDPYQVEFPISSIAIVSKRERIVFVLTDELRETKPTDWDSYDWKEDDIIKIHDNEKEMIEEAVRYILDSPETMVMGYNIDDFDFPYLLTRAELFGLKYEHIWGRTEQIYNVWTQKTESRTIKGITNKFLIDLYTFMSNPSIKNYPFAGRYERNSLEDVAQGLLGTGKVKHEKWFNEMSSAELAYYNLVDTQLIIDLMEYEDEIIFKLMIMLMRIGGLTIESICRRRISATLKGYVDNMLYEWNMISPNRKQLNNVGQIQSSSSTGKGFMGALVIDPTPSGENTRGVHFNVIAVDYQSLYPSEINRRNISFETINCAHGDCKKNNPVPNNDSPITHHVCDRIQGILSELLGFVRDGRVYFFKPQKKNNPQFGIIEQTLKVLINAGYGVFSSPVFDYYCPPFGEIVTAWGRHDIKRVFDKVREDGRQLLYADTDSCFIGETDQEYIDGLIEWTRDNINLELGIDYIADFMVLYRSKNYFMKIGDKFMVKGMLGKKKHTPPIIKEAFENLTTLTKMMTKENYEEIKQKIIVVIRKYKTYIQNKDGLQPEMFKVTMGLSKSPDSYNTPTLQSRAGMAIANKMNDDMERRVATNKLVPAGSIIEYVYVDREYNIDDGGTPVRPLQMTEPQMINSHKYVESLLSATSQIYNCFGIIDSDIDEDQTTLEDWFA